MTQLIQLRAGRSDVIAQIETYIRDALGQGITPAEIHLGHSSWYEFRHAFDPVLDAEAWAEYRGLSVHVNRSVRVGVAVCDESKRGWGTATLMTPDR